MTAHKVLRSAFPWHNIPVCNVVSTDYRKLKGVMFKGSQWLDVLCKYPKNKSATLEV
jgi:hypothetical protein